MSDYKRLVSYIYSYPGGMRDRNVGFAKVEVRCGMFKLNMSLKGVYTDVPEVFGVYLCVDRHKADCGSCTLLHIGNIMVKNGMGQYADLLNADDINKTGYSFLDVTGIAVAKEDNQFYMMFSLWDDDAFNTGKVKFVSKDYRKSEAHMEQARPVGSQEMVNTQESMVAQEPVVAQEPMVVHEQVSQEISRRKIMQIEPDNEIAYEKVNEIAEEIADEWNEPQESPLQQVQKEEMDMEEIPYTITVEESIAMPEVVETPLEVVEPSSDISSSVSEVPQMETLFKNCDYVNAFADDYCFDCIEVTLEQLKNTPIGEEEIVKNSFLEHGYYNFRHLLFGRVQKNERHTEYFIGVPGMYCNRERFMASMFGFNNFKKSHRSDFSNPYFGYWYQEI